MAGSLIAEATMVMAGNSAFPDGAGHLLAGTGRGLATGHRFGAFGRGRSSCSSGTAAGPVTRCSMTASRAGGAESLVAIADDTVRTPEAASSPTWCRASCGTTSCPDRRRAPARPPGTPFLAAGFDGNIEVCTAPTATCSTSSCAMAPPPHRALRRSKANRAWLRSRCSRRLPQSGAASSAGRRRSTGSTRATRPGGLASWLAGQLELRSTSPTCT